MNIEPKRVGLAICITLMLVAVVFVQVAGPVAGEQGAPVENPLTNVWISVGNWTIQNSDSITHSSKTIRLNGNLVVQNGGKLTLTGVKLEINSISQVAPFGIYVNKGGQLILNNCNVTEYLPAPQSTPDGIVFEVKGKLDADNTQFSYLSRPQTPGFQFPPPPNGLQVHDTDQVDIANCTFTRCQESAVYLDNANIVLVDSTLSAGSMPIYAEDSAPVIRRNKIFNGMLGAYFYNPEGMLFAENEIKNVLYYDIYVDGGVANFTGNKHLNGNGAFLAYYVFNSDFDLYDTQVPEDYGYGLFLDSSDFKIYDNKLNCSNYLMFSDNSSFSNNYIDSEYYGLMVDTCQDISIDNNEFLNSTGGIGSWASQRSVITDNTIYDVDIGIQVNRSQSSLGAILTNNTIISKKYDIDLNESRTVESYNTSFDPNKVRVQTLNCTLKTNWLVNLKVEDLQGKALDNANITISNKYDTQVWAGKTNALGRVDNLWVNDYDLGFLGVYNYNPHYVVVEKWNLFDNVSVIFNKGGVYEIDFTGAAPIAPGDWVVNASEYLTYEDSHLDENFIKPDGGNWIGNLTIRPGGTLILDNISLELQSTSAKPFKITVQKGGELVMRNSSIFNKLNSTSSAYGLEIYGDSTFYNVWFNYTAKGLELYSDDVSVDRSNIPSSANGNGVYCYYSDPSVTNSTITTSNYAVFCAGFASPYLYNNELKSAIVGVYSQSNSFGTVLYNQIYNNGGNGIQLASSSPLVKNNYIYNNGGNGIYTNSTNSNFFANHIYNNDFSGMYFKGSSKARVEYNTIYDNSVDGIVISSTSEDSVFADILDNDIYGNNNGLTLSFASPSLKRNHIHNNTNRGISATGSSEPMLDMDMVKNNSVGIYLENSAGMMESVNVSHNTNMGIYLSSSNPRIYNSSVYSNTNRGVYAYSGSSPLLYNLWAGKNSRGIEAYSSDPRIEDCVFDGNTYSIYMTSASPIIGNSTFFAASTKHFYLSVSNPKSVDNTFPNIKDVYLSEPTSKFYYSWWVDVKVIDDQFNPLPNATVQILDKGSSKVVDSGVNDKGYLLGALLHEYSIQDNNNDKDGDDWALSIPEKTDLTPHNITAVCKNFQNTSKIVTINKNYLKDGSGAVVIMMKRPGGGTNSPPSAPSNIKPDQTHSLQPNITWSASTDPEGKPIKYHVTITNETGVKLYNDVKTSNNWFNITSDLSYGNGYHPYDISIYAEDDVNLTSDAATDVFVIVNNPPVLSPIGDKNLTAGDTLSFTITAADPDTNPTDTVTYGTDASYLTFNTGTGAVSWATDENDVGNHSVNFTASDGLGGWDFEVINIWVKPGIPNLNNPPFADAGEDAQSIVNESFKLNGTASYDPDNDTLDYHWEVDHKNYTFNIANSAEPSFTPNETGVWTIKLRVKDKNGTDSLFSGYDEMNLTVIDNTPPVAVIDEPLNNTVYAMDERVFFNATSSSDADTHQTLTYTWYSNNTAGGGNKTAIGTGVLFNTTTLLQGLHTITLEVADTPHGAIASASIWIEVTGPANQPPVPDIKKPEDGKIYFRTVDFNAVNTIDPEDDTLQYTWFSDVDGLLAGDDVQFSRELSLGEHKITLWINDGHGNNVSAFVNIVVENRHPVARFLTDSPGNEGEEMELNATTASDPDGDNLTYSWDFGDGSVGSGKVALHTYSDYGEFNVTLTVNDGMAENNTNSTWKIILVNSPPVAEAGEDHNIMVNNRVDFDASGTTDADNEFEDLIFNWDFGDGFIGVGSKISHTYTQAGTFSVILTVSDGIAVSTDTALVKVRGIGQPPVADPGNDKTVHFEEFSVLEVNFDGSGSFDPADDVDNNSKIDGNEENNLTFSWDFNANQDLDGDGDYTNDNQSTLMKPSFTYDTSGTYVVTLTVTNKMGQSHNASMRVSMNYIPNALGEVDQYGLIDKNVAMDASLSTDPDGLSDITTYKWTFPDGTSKTGKSITYQFTTPGRKEVVLNVTDKKGVSAEASYFVEIFKLTTPTIDEPSAGEEIKSADIITITGSAQKPSQGEFTITAVKISFDGGNKWVNVNNDAGDWSSWSYEWDDSKNHTGENVTIKVRSLSGTSKSDIRTIEITIAKKEESSNTGTYLMIGAVVLVIILAVVIIGVAVWVRGGKKKTPGAAVAAVDYDEDDEGEAEAAAEKPKFKIAPQGAAAAAAGGAARTPAKPSRPAAAPARAPSRPAQPRIKEQPIKCPKCTDIFVVKDDGKRPLKTKCPNCGAKGLIKAEKPKPQKPEAVPIKCPKCTKIFKITGDEKYFECPKCHTKGTLSDSVVDKIREKLGKSVSPLGAAFAGLDRQKVPMESIRCPVCKETFEHPEDENKIECPSCGVKGSL